MQVLEQQLYWKRKFSTGAFLWTLWNFSKHLFYRTPPSNCFRIVGHHHEDLYFCGKFSCNTKLPVQYQPNISASKIVIVKAELLLRPFFKANSLLKIGRLRHINFSSRFINGCGGKKSWNYWCPSSINWPLCPFQKQPFKVFLKGSCFECFEKFLEKRRPSLGYFKSEERAKTN